MKASETTDPGHWLAVAVDCCGEVLDIGDLSEPDQRLAAEEIESIAVVRGSGAPAHRDGVLTMPETCRNDDVLYEVEDLGDDPDRVPTAWAQARAVAAAMNATAALAKLQVEAARDAVASMLDRRIPPTPGDLGAVLSQLGGVNPYADPAEAVTTR